MGQAVTKYKAETLLEEMQEDIRLEEEFLKELGDNKPERIITDLEVLVDVYNEQVTALRHYRIDLETFILLEKREPWNEEWKASKEKTERIMRGRRATLEAVREHLRNYVKIKSSNKK